MVLNWKDSSRNSCELAESVVKAIKVLCITGPTVCDLDNRISRSCRIGTSSSVFNIIALAAPCPAFKEIFANRAMHAIVNIWFKPGSITRLNSISYIVLARTSHNRFIRIGPPCQDSINETLGTSWRGSGGRSRNWRRTWCTSRGGDGSWSRASFGHGFLHRPWVIISSAGSHHFIGTINLFISDLRIVPAQG